MKNNTIVSSYSIIKNHRQNIHSAGPKLYFYNPFIGYVKTGYVKILYKGQTFYAHEGDLIYIAYGTKYQSIWYGSPDIIWFTIEFSFKSPYDFDQYPFQILKRYPPELFDKMYDTYQSSYFISISYFYQLLDDIYKKLVVAPSHPVYNTVEPAIEYIEKNYNQKILMNALAELCNCSESSFFKTFKKATGVTPIAYKQNIMIQNALNLLAHTSLPIEEISTQTGFSSSNYFRTVFIKLTGKTPKELRKK